MCPRGDIFFMEVKKARNFLAKDGPGAFDQPDDVLEAMKQASQSAADAGIADMSLEEINAEIAQARAGK